MAAKAPGYANCVGLWKMNEVFWVEDHAGDVIDSSGQDNHGTAKGDVHTIAGGKIGRCGIFDGTGDYVTLGQPADFDFTPNTDDFSIFAWIKISSGVTGTVISKAESTGANRQYQLLVSDDTLQAYVGGASRNSDATVADGTWHLVGLVNYDDAGTQKFQMYVDGNTAGAVNTSGAGTNNKDVLIGARRDSDNTDSAYLFTGRVDATMIFNKALSQDEIDWLYNGGVGKELCSLNPILHHRKQMAGV